MKYRLVGPFRGGRSLTAVGIPGNPALYYFGAVGGGVWKTTDAGMTWEPIFDSQKIASIGDMAVAPSNPDVIYVGSGEADMRSDITYGDGMYKSTDGGHTWAHIGLEDTRQIGRVLVDPHNPDVVFVAALGHAYGPNPQRGVFRSTDGGKTWSRVLYRDDNTGAIDLAFDPTDSHVIYAAMWQTRRTPWNVYPPSNGPGSGLYKSTDGGSTWQQLTKGLPTEGLGRIGIAVAPTEHNRIYAVVDAKDGGIYRSDDAGASWTRTTNEQRVWTRGWYFGAVTVDPKNPDTIYVSNTAIYKSSDGGKTFVAFKGAPGGDDYHSVWIAPENPSRMIVSSDQGTVITMNGGKTWSSWYNQPTGQMYHAVTDNRFPYWIYGAQQDSGAMAVPSRSNYSSITAHGWSPIPAGGENDMIAPDPQNPEILFGGRVTRYNLVTAQNQNISPQIGRTEQFRHTWTLPLTFSPVDPKKLYFSFQYLYRTLNGGSTWEQISPDLTRPNPGVPSNLDPITAGYGLASARKGVIYALAPSPLDANIVWAGTDDGLIHLTLDDGKNWQDVTPRELTPWSKVGIIEASHFDKQTAYAAIDRHRIEDMKAYIYRTHDGGKSWQLASAGIPEGAFVNVVREDSQRRGLLYAGTELGMYVSFDDGDHWQPLQLNLPVASIRDIVVHGDDLVVGTHGRAFWILDDITPLREVTTQLSTQDAHLFKPQVALRVRPGSDQATPYPPEIPHGQNPPAGAIIDYYLKADSASPVVLEILDSKGAVVRRYASNDKLPVVNEKAQPFPVTWVKPTLRLSDKAGMHRFLWDFHYAGRAVPDPEDDGPGTTGPWAPPGQYTARLTAAGKALTQPLVLKADPRVKASAADLESQFAVAKQAATAGDQVAVASAQATAIQKQLAGIQQKSNAGAEVSAAVEAFSKQLAVLLGPPPAPYSATVIPVETDRSSLRYLATALSELESAVDSADTAPTQEQQSALGKYGQVLQSTLEQWNRLLTRDLPQLNSKLKQAGLAQIRPTSK